MCGAEIASIPSPQHNLKSEGEYHPASTHPLAKISPKMENPRDIAWNVEEEEEVMCGAETPSTPSPQHNLKSEGEYHPASTHPLHTLPPLHFQKHSEDSSAEALRWLATG